MKPGIWNPAGAKSIARQGSQYVAIVAPVMVLVAAISVWFSIVQLEKAFLSGRQTIVNSKSTAQAPVLKQRPLPREGYMDARSVLAAANPAVKVTLGTNNESVIISVADPALMPEWFYLLSTVQSYRSGLIWNAERICLKIVKAVLLLSPKSRRTPRKSPSTT